MIREERRVLTLFTVMILIFTVSFVLGIGAAVASPSASIDPMVTSNLVQGDTFQVTVDVNSDTHYLREINMYMYYNSSALQVNSITEHGLLGSSILTAPGSGDYDDGTILYGIASTADTYLPESGTFLAIEFQVEDTTADGIYNLNLGYVVLKDESNVDIPGVAVTDGRIGVGNVFVNPTVEVDPQVNNGDISDSNNIGTASANTTSLKSVATTQSTDYSTEEVPAAEAGSSMLVIVIGVIVIASYKLKEN